MSRGPFQLQLFCDSMKTTLKKCCCKGKGNNLVFTSTGKRRTGSGLKFLQGRLKSDSRKLDPLYANCTLGSLYSLQHWRRGKVCPSWQTREQCYTDFAFVEGRQTIWSEITSLWFHWSYTSHQFLSWKTYFLHYFSSSRGSFADNSASSDRDGGEACFRQLPSAKETHECRKVQPMSRRGCKEDSHTCGQRSACVTSQCYVRERKEEKIWVGRQKE